MIVAIYARVSSDRQAKQATIESQLAELRARVEADGQHLASDHTFVDDGFSGASLVRPGLERLRDAVAARTIDRIYVHSPDRIARRFVHQAVLQEELARGGATLVFLNGGESRTPEEAMLVQMQGVFAEYERAKIAERTRRGRIHRARMGQVSVLSGAPYGYRYVPRSDEAPAEFQVVLGEARVVRDIFRWLVEEHASIREIARRLDAAGIPTRGGGAWALGTLKHMLENRAYVGTAEFGKREAVARGAQIRPGRGRPTVARGEKTSARKTPPEQRIGIPVPALVTEATFAAARDQLARNRALSARRATEGVYLLQGLVRCGRCGYAVSGTKHGPASKCPPVAYYRCRSAAAKVRCGMAGVRGDLLETHVWAVVRSLLEDPARLAEEWQRRLGADGTVGALREQEAAARRELRTVELQIQRIGDAFEAGVFALDDFQVRMERAKLRRQRAQEQVDRAVAQLGRSVELTAVIAAFGAFQNLVATGLDTLSWAERRRVVRAVVSYVTLDENGATVTFRVPGTDPGAPPVSGSDVPDGTEPGPSGEPGAGARGIVALRSTDHPREIVAIRGGIATFPLR
jgi:site-specific DNA recombinase